MATQPEGILVSIDEAAALLGVSRDTFNREVRPHVRVVPVGVGRRARKLFKVKDLVAWSERAAVGAGPQFRDRG